MFKKILVFLIAFLFLTMALANVKNVLAQEEVVSPIQEGLQISRSLTDWDLFLKNVKEKIDLALTFDPIKKAEKQLKYADENLKLAEILSARKTEKEKAKMQDMIKKANIHLEKIEAKREKWGAKIDDKVAKLKERLANHLDNKERILERIEGKLDAAKIKDFEELRANGLERGERLINAIQNENLPEDIKFKLEQTKARIEERSKEIKEFVEAKKELMDKAVEGDEAAKEELKKANKNRVENRVQRRSLDSRSTWLNNN